MSTATETPIDRLLRHADIVKAGQGKVQPGQPMTVSEAADVGEGVWQGDLGIGIIAILEKGQKFKVPEGFKRQTVDENCSAEVLSRLTPDFTQGGAHCLLSLDGVEVYRPAEWPAVKQNGPILVLSKPCTIGHPIHGDVTIPANRVIQICYQREWDAELKQERRNRD